MIITETQRLGLNGFGERFFDRKSGGDRVFVEISVLSLIRDSQIHASDLRILTNPSKNQLGSVGLPGD